MRFVFEQIRTGGDRNFAYLLGDRLDRVAAAIDPSFDPAAVFERARAQKLFLRTIINTHSHPDHINGNEELRRLSGAKVAAYKCSPVEPDVEIEDDQELLLGSILMRFLHTPGHADDHLVIWLPQQKVALTGDLLFVGKVGGTEDDGHAQTERESLARVFRDLPDETTIWPGHDYGARPSSTIALERATNPFILAQSLPEFLNLKRDWPRFKASFGLR